MKYKVKFNIGEEVKHTFSDDALNVLGYEILPNGLRYICVNSKLDYKYCYEIELKQNKHRRCFLEITK